jgi:MarR family transcriptional regulator, organic hydroperoxide resistance regulator
MDGTPLSTAATEGLDGVDELSMRVFRAFMKALRLHRRLMMGAMTDRDMHPGQAFCLRLLVENDGMTQRDVAAGLHISAPTISRMLRSMDKAGLVRRLQDAADQRLTRVFVTPAGRDLEARLRAVAATYVNDTIGRLPEDDRRELARLLEKLGGQMDDELGVHGDEAPAQATATQAAGAPAETLE